jgi:hypothetical protein
MKKVNLLSRAEMRNVMGGNPPEGGGGSCWASCRDKDMNILSPEGGLSVTSCEGSTALTACTAAYTKTDSTGCYCV